MSGAQSRPPCILAICCAGSGPEGEPFADVAANKDSDDGDYEDASSHEQVANKEINIRNM